MAEHWVTKSSKEPLPPRRSREYTQKERWANWWDYHWHYIAGGLAVLLIGGYIVYGQLRVVKPDYQIALCAKQNLPVDTSEQLSQALAAYGQDLNGDGKVTVQINQYTVDFSQENEGDAYDQMAGMTRLWADIQSQQSYIYLTDDLEGFAARQGASLDGVESYEWEDCPVLAGLDLGSYERETLVDSKGGDSQEYMSRFTLFHRAGEVTPEDQALWEALTQGAVS